MAFFRQWLLILAVLALGAGTVSAASREDRAYVAAASAFQDQNWARAETGLAAFVHKYPHSKHLAEALLLQAQAQFQQGKFTDALSLLTAQKPQAGDRADQFDYWIGEVQAATGDYAGAADSFTALTQNYPASTLRLRATIEAAAAFAQNRQWLRVGNLLQADGGVFQTAAGSDATNELVARGWLLLAQAQSGQNDFAAAAATLNLLAGRTLPPDLNWQRLHLLGQVKLGGGDFEGALAAGTNALAAARQAGRADWLAVSRAVLAQTLGKLNRRPEAMACWRENLDTQIPAEAQNEAVLNLASLALAQTNFAEAETNLEAFLVRAPGSPTAELTRLTLGRLHLGDFAGGTHDSNHLALARARFDQVLANTNGPLAGSAWLGRGWCDWLEPNLPASRADFQQAVQLLAGNGSAADLATARFKTGDASYQTGEALLHQNDRPGARENFLSARNSYRAVLNDAATHPDIAQALGDRALYQILRTDLKLKDAEDAEAALAKLLAVFPKSELADNSLLLAGEEFSDFGRPAQARETLQQCATLFSESPLLPEVAFAVARTYERETNWAAAIAGYEAWLKQYPTNELLPQVSYARAQANYLAGNETNALALFNGFVAQFPTNELAPQAQWWLADYYFRTPGLGGADNFVAAETNYENIFQNTNAAWKSSQLYYPAQLMAARAAMSRLGFSDACGYLVKLLGTNCPAELAVPARFAYGAALMQTPATDTNSPLANFQMATNIFSQICQLCPTNDPGARAWGEIGNCAAVLGDYPAATNAYLQAVNFPGAETGTRNQAGVGLGLALEKFAAAAAVTNRADLLRQAREQYEAVFYDEAPDPFWQKEAGLRALQLLPTTDLPAATNLIRHLERLFPQLQPSLEKKLAGLAPAKN